MMQANDSSIKFDLRHLNSPSISVHILAIEFDDSEFLNMSRELKEQLLEFGITDQVPGELEFSNTPIESIHEKLNDGNKRVVGVGYLWLVVLSGVMYGLFLYLDSIEK